MVEMFNSKKGQEEMIGFALIVVVVSVILLIFLGFSLGDDERESVESYEVESFIGSLLQHTTSCRDNFEALDVQDLIYRCDRNQACSNNEDPCSVLGTTVEGIVKSSWQVGSDRPIKGYDLDINIGNMSLVEASGGNITSNSKGSAQFLPNNVEVVFTAYY